MILAAAIACVSVLAVAVFTDIRAVDLAVRTATEGLAAETRLFAQKLETAYAAVEKDATFSASMPPVAGLIRAQRSGGVDPLDASTRDELQIRLAIVFQKVLETSTDYMQMRFITLEGGGREIVRVVQSAGLINVVPEGQLGTVGERGFFREALASGLTGVQFSAVTKTKAADGPWPVGATVWHVLSPVRDEAGRLYGFVVIDVNYARMLERILRETPRVHQTLIFNSDGDFIERSADEAVTRFHLHGEAGAAPFVDLGVLSPGMQETAVRQDDGISYVVRKNMHAHRPGAFIGVAFREPESALLASARATRLGTALVGLLVLALALLLAFVLSRRFADYVVDVAARSRAVIESALDGIISIDDKGTILSDNPAAERIFQFGPGDLIGQKIEVLMPKTIADAHDGYLEAYHRTGKRHVIGSVREVTGQRRDGTQFPLELSVSELRIGGRTIYTGLVRDISQRKAADEALKLTQERSDLVIGAMSAGFWEWDLKAGTVFWSARAREILGLDATAPPPDFSLLAAHRHPDDNAAVIEGIETCIRGGVRFDHEYRFYRFDGPMIWIHATAVIAYDLEGRPARLVGSVTDITDRKEAEVERERLIAALAQSNRELDEFAYVASHDLKAPLRVIENASTWLEEDLADRLDPDSRENLQLLRSRVSRMERLLDDLLEYSRIGRKTNEQWNEAISGQQLKEDILLLVPQKDGFEVAFEPEFDAITVSRMPLQQILINLIGNAIKHHDRASGTVLVRVRPLVDEYQFSVIDDGPGIPEQYHEQIFKMFQTLKPRDRVEGSGIGLAIVRKHLDVLKKSMKVERAGERGSIFTFTYPIRAEKSGS